MSLSFCSEFLLCYFFTFEIIVLFPQEVFCEENWNFGKMIALENATILPRAVHLQDLQVENLHKRTRLRNWVEMSLLYTRWWMLFALKVQTWAAELEIVIVDAPVWKFSHFLPLWLHWNQFWLISEGQKLIFKEFWRL